MSTLSLKEAKTRFSGLVDQALKGGFVTITRHGKPVAALVSLEAAEIARKALEERPQDLSAISGHCQAENSTETDRPRGTSNFERLPTRHERRFDAFADPDGGADGILRLARAPGLQGVPVGRDDPPD